MVSFRGQKKLAPRPDQSPLRVLFKISDEHPRPLNMRSPPPENKFAMLIREPQDWGNYRKLHDRCRKSDTFDCKPRSFRG